MLVFQTSAKLNQHSQYQNSTHRQTFFKSNIATKMPHAQLPGFETEQSFKSVMTRIRKKTQDRKEDDKFPYQFSESAGNFIEHIPMLVIQKLVTDMGITNENFREVHLDELLLHELPDGRQVCWYMTYVFSKLKGQDLDYKDALEDTEFLQDKLQILQDKDVRRFLQAAIFNKSDNRRLIPEDVDVTDDMVTLTRIVVEVYMFWLLWRTYDFMDLVEKKRIQVPHLQHHHIGTWASVFLVRDF